MRRRRLAMNPLATPDGWQYGLSARTSADWKRCWPQSVSSRPFPEPLLRTSTSPILFRSKFACTRASIQHQPRSSTDAHVAEREYTTRALSLYRCLGRVLLSSLRRPISCCVRHLGYCSITCLSQLHPDPLFSRLSSVQRPRPRGTSLSSNAFPSPGSGAYSVADGTASSGTSMPRATKFRHSHPPSGAGIS